MPRLSAWYRPIWPEGAIMRGDSGLDPILSRLRGVLRSVGLTGADAGIVTGSGTVSLQLPGSAWVDIEVAVNAADEADGASRRHDRAAWGLANTAAVIAKRPFLPGAEAPWIEGQRAALRALHLRALHCLATLSAANGEGLLAVQHAAEMLQLDPFRETAYQLLMRLHAAAGDRAEALRVFGRCRALLREELGVAPSPQTEAVDLEILRAE